VARRLGRSAGRRDADALHADEPAEEVVELKQWRENVHAFTILIERRLATPGRGSHLVLLSRAGRVTTFEDYGAQR
jgi:hypothetical protein